MLTNSYYFRLKKILFFALLLCIFHATTKAQNDGSQNIGRNGEVFPYPYNHFTFIQPRFDRQNLLYGNYFDTYAIRVAKTFEGSYHLRLDLPMANTNSSGENIFGLSDTKIRLLHAIPLVEHWYFGYGAEATLPTATNRSLGSGKWQMRPELGAMYFIGQPKHIIGTFSLGVDYRFDFAGQSDRQHVSVLGIAPNIDYWAKKWYIGYYATWTYDFINHIWDIPIDVECGYTILPKVTLAAEFIQPLIKKRTYNNEYSIKLRYIF